MLVICVSVTKASRFRVGCETQLRTRAISNYRIKFTPDIKVHPTLQCYRPGFNSLPVLCLRFFKRADNPGLMLKVINAVGGFHFFPNETLRRKNKGNYRKQKPRCRSWNQGRWWNWNKCACDKFNSSHLSLILI